MKNRVQELLEKDAQGAYAGAALHFIGRLQRNKVKYRPNGRTCSGER